MTIFPQRRTQAFGGRAAEKEEEVERNLVGNETVLKKLAENPNGSFVFVVHRWVYHVI